MDDTLQRNKPTCDKGAARSKGISLLEMMVTLVIVVIIVGVVLSLFNNVSRQRNRYHERLERQAKIENCMSRMIEEIAMMGENGELKIVQDQQGWQIASHLTIEYRNHSEESSDVMRVIEWVSMPRYAQQDLVLFRREKRQGSQENDFYIPICDGLYSFDVHMVDAAGELIDEFSALDENSSMFDATPKSDEDPNEPVESDDPNNVEASQDDPNAPGSLTIEAQPVVEIVAEMYQFDNADAENLQTYRRTFCLKRF